MLCQSDKDVDEIVHKALNPRLTNSTSVPRKPPNLHATYTFVLPSTLTATMLLKLIPGNSEPTIHFSLSFSDLPPQLPMPAAWSAQLTQLMLEDLEVPVTIHSLDKAAGLASLLEEVALDVGANEVRCRFVDGKVEKWGFWDGIVGIGPWKAMAGSLYGQRLLEALEGIMRDVKESTLEDERLAREKEWEKQKLERSRSLSTATAPKGILGKVSKHKKQRSFFMQIVSSIGYVQ